MNGRFLLISVIVASAVLSAPPLNGFAQTRKGLDALSDDALLDELAQRGMDSLLEHAFAVQKTPASKQAAIRTIVKMRQLGDPNARLSSAQRQKLIGEIVKGIDSVLPSMNDPRMLLRQAADLTAAGVERDINTLEYWGDNPRTQAQVRPVVQTVIKLLDRCVAQATRQADEAANAIANPDDKAAITRYEQLDALAREAEYTKFMTDYYLVLAIDRADPKRNEVATKAIEFLKQYDVAEQPIRARVRNSIGKLSLTVGDLATARTMFDSIVNASAQDFQPPPDVGLQYEARYFRALTDLAAQSTDAAAKGLDELETWQRSHLPDPDTQRDPAAKTRARDAQHGARAAAAMLRYRILSQRAELANDAASKRKFNDDAVAVLYKLLAEQPGLQAIVYDQLMSKLPENAPLADLDALLLQAILRRGEAELLKPEGAATDARALERGLAAADEITARAQNSARAIEPQLADSAALLRGFFLDKSGKDEEACAALLDYVKARPESKNRDLALDNAQALVAKLRREKRDSPQVAELYDRFLAVAVAPPFNRKQFAYEYARRLQIQDKPREAVEFFRQVPADDKRILAARFFHTVALQQELDDLKPDDAGRAALAAEMQRLAGEVNAAAGQALADAATVEEKNNYRSMLARTTLLAAEMARVEQHDPQRALDVLAQFETAIEGLPDAPRRLTDALLVRVHALMSLNQYSAATNELVRLLDREPTGGGRVVYDLLESLNQELDKAQAAGNEAQVRAISRDRAQLTGFLVQWAQKSPNEAIKKLAYGYAVFDAEVKRFAAVHEPDAAAKSAGLEKALALFSDLGAAEGLAQYRATLRGDSAKELSAYDASVVMGVARTMYDLGRFGEARDQFSRLLNDRRLGPPVIIGEDNGERREIDNDNYWEAVLKLIRSNVALNSGVEESKSYLKQQIVRWADRVGGRKWKKEFQQLRTELIPDYDPALPATLPASAPTTAANGAD